MTIDPVKLEVADAYSADNHEEHDHFIRIGATEILALHLSPGDEISIKTPDETTISKKVWRTDRADWDQNIVRINEATQDALGVKPGDTVTLHPIIAQQHDR